MRGKFSEVLREGPTEGLLDEAVEACARVDEGWVVECDRVR